MSFSLRAALLHKSSPRNVQCRLFSQYASCRQQAPTPSVRQFVKSPELKRKHIHLVGIPRSAKPADVLRLARQSIQDDGLAKNIAEARLEYRRFMPTGRAYVTMRSSHYVEQACNALRDTQMSSLPVKAFVSPLTGTQRMRGNRGRTEGAERAAFDGSGLGGGVDPKGCDVVLYGLPGTIAAPALRLYLRRIGMVGVAPNGEPDCDVLKVEVPSRRRSFTAISKHLVRLNSPAEAHAFVRRMHLTYFLPEVWFQKYLIRAKVVY